MAHASSPRASGYVFRVPGRFGQDIKAAARAAGFAGNSSQSPLLTYMSVKSRVEGFLLKLLGPALIGEKGHKASDAGTLHLAHFVPFQNNHLGFFTV